MNINTYKQLLNMSDATFTLIAHEEAMVATVYKITSLRGEEYVLKIFERSNDYFREMLFLTQLAETLPVPKIIQRIDSSDAVHGALLMEFFQGVLLKEENFTESIAYEIGRCLATIHLNRLSGYGDPIKNNLQSDPRPSFALKFEEGLEECMSHLPDPLIKKCKDYFYAHLDLLTDVDGPCIAHRDFRPGNIIVNEGKLAGIIDWASARASFAEEDLCSLTHWEWSNYPYQSSLLAGYANIRSVPDYMRLAPLLRLNKAIATIGFFVKQKTWDTRDSRIYQYNLQFLENLL